jgi:hypothetical protein
MKEIEEITNKAVARGSFTKQEEKRIQEIQEELTAEYTSDPQTKRLLEQQKQKEQQEEQKRQEEIARIYAINTPVPPKLSVKYKSAEYELRDKTLILTWDNQVKRVRIDYWYEGDGKGREINIANSLNKTLFLHGPAGWQDDEYDAIEMHNRIGTLIDRIDYKKHMSRWRSSFVRQSLPDRTYAGKVCKVYFLKEVQSDFTRSVTYAFWNDVVLFYEYKETRHGESEPSSITTYEAVSVTENVPETAFTKTLNISWHR